MSSPPPLSTNALGLQLLESVWIGFSITAMVLAARVYTRAIMVRQVGWDDYIMLAAFVGFFSSSVKMSTLLTDYRS